MALVTIGFLTLEGSAYSFPDVEVEEAERLAAYFPEKYSQVTLVNASGACLVVPLRVVRVYLVEGQERWIRPSPA
jgi:hypothetical protein